MKEDVRSCVHLPLMATNDGRCRSINNYEGAADLAVGRAVLLGLTWIPMRLPLFRLSPSKGWGKWEKRIPKGIIRSYGFDFRVGSSARDGHKIFSAPTPACASSARTVMATARFVALLSPSTLVERVLPSPFRHVLVHWQARVFLHSTQTPLRARFRRCKCLCPPFH